MRHVSLRCFALALASLWASAGCTMITEAGEYEEDATAFIRDLDYVFDMRSPGVGGKPAGGPTHFDAPLDVAVVNQDNLLRARARITLPITGEEDYQPERLLMENALLAGETYRLLFFVDSLKTAQGEVGDYRVNGSADAIAEHVWIETPAADGTGRFEHSTNFRFFEESDYRSNTDLALRLPVLDNLLPIQQTCLNKKLRSVLEVRVRSADRRVVGLIRHYPGTTLPIEEIRLNGIIDASATYELEASLGAERRVVEFTAADEVAIERTDRTTSLAFRDWFPACM